ncbi:MAG: hypothetical protein ACREYF_03945 [Gammaproteobacteria bacterium]
MPLTIQLTEDVPNGTERDIDGKPCVYYDGYWIRRYDIRNNSLASKKVLIDQLTRRVFHHTEPGINTPASKLDEARRAYECQTDPARKRVNAAMLAGALLHRAAEILTRLVELEQAGIVIAPQNELLRECGRCYLEASQLAKQVKHYSGEEGLDELWGEPFRAFSLPVEEFYRGRYTKIAQTMAALDAIAETLITSFRGYRGFEKLADVVTSFAAAAKLETETPKSDAVIFEVWPTFVATGDAMFEFQPELPANLSEKQQWMAEEGVRLIQGGTKLMSYIASARVPMPKSSQEYSKKLDAHSNKMSRLYPRC